MKKPLQMSVDDKYRVIKKKYKNNTNKGRGEDRKING